MGGGKITDSVPNVSGALYNTGFSNNIPSGGTYGNKFGIGLNASKSNPIYGKSTTVQPPAITIVAWRRES